MKKIISILLIICLLVCGVGCRIITDVTTASPELPINIVSTSEPLIQEEITYEIASEDSTKIEIIDSQLDTTQIVSSTIVYIEPTNNTAAISNKTDSEYTYDFIQAFKVGDYQFCNLPPKSCIWQKNLHTPEIVHILYTYQKYTGILLNQSGWNLCYTTDGNWYICTFKSPSIYTVDEITNRLTNAYVKAITIYNIVHNDALTKYDQVQAYVDYLSQNCSGTYPIDLSTINDSNRNLLMALGDTYATLVNNSGRCISKAAALDLLLELEGIPSYGLNVEGHSVSYIVIDNIAYACDWGTGIGIISADKITSTWNTNFERCNLTFLQTL